LEARGNMDQKKREKKGGGQDIRKPGDVGVTPNPIKKTEIEGKGNRELVVPRG